MEQFIKFVDADGLLRSLLLTTAANRGECQAVAWWDDADVIVQLDDRGAKILKGERREKRARLEDHIKPESGEVGPSIVDGTKI